MSNVLAEDKRQQVLALARLGWSLRRIERATGVRRETASGYLKAAGVVVRGRGRPPTAAAKPAISPEVSTDSSVAPSPGADTDPAPATSGDHPTPSPRASACEPYRELIVEAVDRACAWYSDVNVSLQSTAIGWSVPEGHCAYPWWPEPERRSLGVRPSTAGPFGDRTRRT